MTELELIWRKKGKGDWNLCKSGFTTFNEVTALLWVIFKIVLVCFVWLLHNIFCQKHFTHNKFDDHLLE